MYPSLNRNYYSLTRVKYSHSDSLSVLVADRSSFWISIGSIQRILNANTACVLHA